MGEIARSPYARIAQIRNHVAWLGEGRRLAWWATDALSADAGGAMLEAIFPITYAYAAMQIAWASAGVVESRASVPRPALTLFDLGAAKEAGLLAWLRTEKRTRNPIPPNLVPAEEPSTPRSTRDAFVAWGLLDDARLREASQLAPIPGTGAVKIGEVGKDDLLSTDALAHVVERLAAGYVHARANQLVVPFLAVV